MTFITFKSRTKKINAGFTLVEMMVYLALLIVISISAVVALISFSDALQSYRTNQLLVRNGIAVLERFQTDVRSAQDVDVVNSTLGVSPGALRVLTGATTTDFTVNGSVITVATNGVPQELTRNTVTVDALEFNVYENVVTEMVRMQVTLTATVGATTRTQTFTTAVVLRGSYE